MRYTVVATFESPQGLHVVIRKFWRLKKAQELRLSLASWHLLGLKSEAKCHVAIIGPTGGWM